MEQQHMPSRREERPATSSTSQSSNSVAVNDPGPAPPLPVLHPSLHSAPTASTFSPPAYSQAASANIHLPDVPTTELPLPRSRAPAQNDADNKLPALSSVASTQPLRNDQSWLVLNPMLSYRSPTQSHLPSIDSPLVMDVDSISNGPVSAASPDRFLEPRASSVSLDDPDVRMAAEALGDLRADFVSSPPQTNVTLPPLGASAHTFQGSTTSPQAPEPLLSLLTTSHPLLATTIEGATSAYGGAKNFSPRFKSGAEYVEGYLTPIASTVGTVGRVTGVEGSVRWFLGAGRRHGSSSDLEAGTKSNKRRKVDSSSEAPVGLRIDASEGSQQAILPISKSDRRLSMSSTDTLPAYDDVRTPAYTETSSAARGPTSPPAAWQSRLIMSTSGLSIAMSKESLRSLKYCLSWLRWANNHISRIINALKNTLEEYDRVGPGVIKLGEEEKGGDIDMGNSITCQDDSRSQLVARINTLKNDVLKTLQDVMNTVSKYAGGALPENARILVRRHLTSLPQRFRIATMAESSPASATRSDANDGESAMRDSAHKIMVLATEGLDIIIQVSGVLDGTIVSAEEWCERMGKKRDADTQDDKEKQTPQMEEYRDVKMG
ncbi:transcription factor Opi1-domain-containing protein [Stachybotrys elegans]|uniref:Transcription factor Opi1-domain-containing protein n=1 Tax=Stachybotrys elegans TaxID=80388 RepID=A0A8K0SUP2_9HYPO|nr:transcription factor Opi1-domain-containing protein [Stachybotrys elegans]